MSNIIPLKYESKEIRVIQDENGNLWWVAKDICSILGLNDTGRAIQALDRDESKTFRVTDRLNRKQDTYIISEPGLYRLLSRSSKQEAKKFQRWIFHDVLPSIRLTGSYEIKGLSEIDLIIKSAQVLKKVEAKQVEHDNRISHLEAKSHKNSAQTGYWTITAWCKLNKMSLTLEEAMQKGREATKLSKKWGAEIGGVHDERFGFVNSYREDVLEEVFGIEVAPE